MELVEMDLVETYFSADLPRDVANSAGELLVRTWPRPGVTVELRAQQLLGPGREYTGPAELAPRSVVIRRDGRVVAHAMLFARTVKTAEGPLTVAALSKVCVDAALRGQHLGERVVRTAFEPVDSGVFPFALFQTTPAVRPFYVGLGAIDVTNRCVNSLATDPQARPWWDDVVLRYPADRPGWPKGEIDLVGPAF
jgi:hypothetical protein